MAGIVYSKMVGTNDPVYGKIDTPVRMLLEHESNLWEKRKTITKSLFNIENSKRFAETYLGQSDFNVFEEVSEGQGAPNDNVSLTFRKTIMHHTFMKEFTITKEMVEDAKFGIAVEGRDKATGFVRAYYKTQNMLAERALINATQKSFVFSKGEFDLTAQDELPLFHKAHTYHTEAMKKFKQSNRFYVNVTAEDFVTGNAFESIVGEGTVKMQGFNDDNGSPMGYIADTIIVPGNSYKIRAAAKKLAGSERVSGSDFNDVNLQFGNWNIVVLPEWRPATPKVMLMSSEANKQLHGNNLLNRTKLEVRNWVDNHTHNLIWSGRGRFGIGFANWKHIMLIEQGENAECEEMKI